MRLVIFFEIISLTVSSTFSLDIDNATGIVYRSRQGLVKVNKRKRGRNSGSNHVPKHDCKETQRLLVESSYTYYEYVQIQSFTLGK